MESDEVIIKIQDAIKAMKSYKREKLMKKSASKKDALKKIVEDIFVEKDDKEILKEAQKLIKEAYMLGQSGQSGQTCPRCGGSGRV